MFNIDFWQHIFSASYKASNVLKPQTKTVQQQIPARNKSRPTLPNHCRVQGCRPLVLEAPCIPKSHIHPRSFKKNTIKNKWVSQTKRIPSATPNARPPSPDTSRSSLDARNRNPNARCQMQKPCSAMIRARIRDLNARCKKTNAMPCRARARTRHPSALYMNANAMLCYPCAQKCHPRARGRHLNAR